MRVLVTRPEKDSTELARILGLAGHEAILSPMLTIVPLAWDMPTENIDAVVLTSHNAVTEAHREKLKNIPCYCIGQTTADAARAAGYHIVASCGGDRAALVQSVAADKPRHALYLSGHDERADLFAELATVGVRATKRRVYEARAVTAFSPSAVSALQNNSIDYVLLYSPRSARLFRTLLDALPGAQKSGLVLACLSAAVADACGADWAQIIVAQTPTTAHLLAASGLLCDSAQEALKDRV